MKSDPTVFVVDDDPAMRRSLSWLMESAGLTVSTHATAREFLDTCDPEQPGCLVLDVRMPGLSGLDLQQELIARNVTVPIIFITAYGEVPIAVRALKGGAVDFLEKPFSDHVLLERIWEAIGRDRRWRDSVEEQASLSHRLQSLTAREREVLDMVIAGSMTKEIATALGLSPKTVERHRSRIMKKAGVDSLAELVRLGLQLQGGAKAAGAGRRRGASPGLP